MKTETLARGAVLDDMTCITTSYYLFGSWGPFLPFSGDGEGRTDRLPDQ